MYVNYGRVEDFEKLTKNLSVNVTGKIAIMRYGKIFRGNKVMLAGNNVAVQSTLLLLIISVKTDPNCFEAQTGKHPDKPLVYSS